MADRTVMVVEDDAVIREMVLQVLASEGFTAVGAGNGEEALRQLRTDHLQPALILLDLVMPVMNGWQFRTEQLRDPELAAIPVVVMSATDDGAVRAEDRVPKPFDIDQLVEVVTRVARPGHAVH
ncbi:MAG TPA: response regulator [Anaeromyxobacteraceae bacterium]|nr:response regulator [Anaeromyxobacteraceae bacterium]